MIHAARVGEFFIADQIDVANAGGFAFGNIEGDIDSVAVKLGNLRGHRCIVFATIVVLAIEFLGNAVKVHGIEGFTLRNADVLEAFL